MWQKTVNGGSGGSSVLKHENARPTGANLSYTLQNDYSDAYVIYQVYQGNSWNSMTISLNSSTGTCTWEVNKEKLQGSSTSGIMYWRGHIENVKAGDTFTGYLDNPWYALIEIIGI